MKIKNLIYLLILAFLSNFGFNNNKISFDNKKGILVEKKEEKYYEEPNPYTDPLGRIYGKYNSDNNQFLALIDNENSNCFLKLFVNNFLFFLQKNNDKNILEPITYKNIPSGEIPFCIALSQILTK